MTPIPFEILKVGHCQQNERMACRAAPWRRSDFPALVALLRHPDAGVMLFDTGYAARFFAATTHWPERLYRVTTPVTLPDDEVLTVQLAARGLSPGDIDTIIVSHFHGDHVCGLKDFPDADFICARAGLEQVRAVRGVQAVRRGLLGELVPEDFEARVRFVDDAAQIALSDAVAPFTTGHDLLGDGSVIAIDLPGHAVGQFGLLFTAEGGGLILLAADAAFSMRAIRENALPMALAGLLLGHSPDYARTLARLHALNGQNPGVTIIPSHCRERMREFTQ